MNRIFLKRTFTLPSSFGIYSSASCVSSLCQGELNDVPIVIDTFDQVFLGPRSDTWLVQQFAFYGIKGTTDMLLFIIMVNLSGLIFVWTFFRELRIHIFGFDKISRIEGFQNFVGTKYRQNGQKWRKSRKIGENGEKIEKIAKKWRKSRKNRENREKMEKIAKN